MQRHRLARAGGGDERREVCARRRTSRLACRGHVIGVAESGAVDRSRCGETPASLAEHRAVEVERDVSDHALGMRRDVQCARHERRTLRHLEIERAVRCVAGVVAGAIGDLLHAVWGVGPDPDDDAFEMPFPVAAVVGIGREHDLGVRLVRRDRERSRAGQLVDTVAGDRRIARHGTEHLQREARGQVGGRSAQPDDEPAAVRSHPGDAVGMSGGIGVHADDVSEYAGSGRTDPRVSGSLDGADEGPRGHGLVGRRREPEARADDERVGATAIAHRRHRLGDIGREHLVTAGSDVGGDELRTGCGGDLAAQRILEERRVEGGDIRRYHHAERAAACRHHGPVDDGNRGRSTGHRDRRRDGAGRRVDLRDRPVVMVGDPDVPVGDRDAGRAAADVYDVTDDVGARVDPHDCVVTAHGYPRRYAVDGDRGGAVTDGDRRDDRAGGVDVRDRAVLAVGHQDANITRGHGRRLRPHVDPVGDATARPVDLGEKPAGIDYPHAGAVDRDRARRRELRVDDAGVRDRAERAVATIDAVDLPVLVRRPDVGS